MFDREVFDEARKEFLAHLLYAKGHSKTTYYAYNLDLGIWGTGWLGLARTGKPPSTPTWSSSARGSCASGR